MREMLQVVASWFPDRQFVFLGDSLYTGESVLSHLPDNIDMIGAVHPKGALYEPASKKRSGRGAPSKKGKRLPSRDCWAASNTPWTSFTFDQFGLHGTLETKTRTGLYYKAGKDRLLRFVLTRDAELQQGGNTLKSQRIVYDALKDVATAGDGKTPTATAKPTEGGGQRVRITLQPRKPAGEDTPTASPDKP